MKKTRLLLVCGLLFNLSLHAQSGFFETSFSQQFVPLAGIDYVEDNTLFMLSYSYMGTEQSAVNYMLPRDTFWRSLGMGKLTLRYFINSSTFFNRKTMVIYVLDSQKYFVSNDSGKTFVARKPSFNGMPVVTLHVGSRIIASNGGGVFISEDTCKTFYEIQQITLTGNNVAYLKDSHIIINNRYQNLHLDSYAESFDAGKTWDVRTYRTMPKTASDIFLLKHLDDSIVYYALPGKPTHIFWSYNRAFNFNDSMPLPHSDYELSDIAFATPNIGYALYANSILYKTYDGGNTWNRKDSFEHEVCYLETLPNNWVVATGNNIFRKTYTSIAIYISKNGGEFVSTGPSTSGNNSPMNVYPNPANGQFNIAYRSNTEGAVTVSIFDMAGKMVNSLQRHVYNGNNTISVAANLHNGLYQVLVQNGNSMASTTLVVE